MKKINELWYQLNRIDDMDVLAEIEDYIILLGIDNYRIMIYNGEEGIVVSWGSASYLLQPNIDTMELLMYKKDDLNLRKYDRKFKRNETWRLKKRFVGDDTWWKALRFISGGKKYY